MHSRHLFGPQMENNTVRFCKISILFPLLWLNPPSLCHKKQIIIGIHYVKKRSQAIWERVLDSARPLPRSAYIFLFLLQYWRYEETFLAILNDTQRVQSLNIDSLSKSMCILKTHLPKRCLFECKIHVCNYNNIFLIAQVIYNKKIQIKLVQKRKLCLIVSNC